MKKLFDELSVSVSKQTTEKYSTSFSLGIMALSNDIRPAIYSIYGFVRLADEIVDSFHDYDRCSLLKQFREQTYQALECGISLNPILNSFQGAVHKYNVDVALIDSFLESMSMDLEQLTYNTSLYEKYIYGSAEVVGLMCLQVFVKGDKVEFERLKPYARILGSAFQKVNFLRDLKADQEILGRTYFPNVNFTRLNEEDKKSIELDIQQEFDQALKGIRMLPSTSRFGVLLAFNYYRSLFYKIRSVPATRIKSERVRVPNGEKLWLTFTSYVQYKVAFR